MLWRVDPASFRDLWWVRAYADEARRRAWDRSIKRCLAGGMDGVGLPEVDLVGCQQSDACVMKVHIIPAEEAAAEGAGLVNGFEMFGKRVIDEFLTGYIIRIHAAIFGFWAGVMPPMPMFGQSLLQVQGHCGA